MFARNEEIVKHKLAEGQGGFHFGCNITNQLFIQQQVFEKLWGHCQWPSG